MNPFSHYGKSFLNSRLSPNSQPTPINTTTHPTLRTETQTPPAAAVSFNYPGFQPARLSDQNLPARRPPSYDSFSLPNKRVRHTQEEFSEVRKEPAQQPGTQPRTGTRLEDQIQSQGGIKLPGEGTLGSNAGFRKVQGSSVPIVPQESSLLSGNTNMRDAASMMLLKQCLNRYKKDQMMKEPAQNQGSPGSYQNEAALYSLLANNLNLGNLFPSAFGLNINNVLALELLKHYEAQQFSQFLQANQQLHTLQDSSKVNTTLRNNTGDSGTPSLRIPPLNPIVSFSEYLGTAQTGGNGFSGTGRTEGGEKNQARSTSMETEIQKFNSGRMADVINKDLKLSGQSPRKDEKENKPQESSNYLLTIPEHQSAVSVQALEEKETNVKSESDSRGLITLRRKSSDLNQNLNSLGSKKERDTRQKNRWQLLIEKTEKSSPKDSPGTGPYEKFIKKTKLDREGSSKELRKLKPVKESLYEDQDSSKDFKRSRLGSSSQRKKRGGKRTLATGKEANNKALFVCEESRNYSNDSTGISITSSIGKTAEELTLDKADQKTVNTRVGDEYQAHITDIEDLNMPSVAMTRNPKVLWDPESLEAVALEAYFGKLQEVLGCKGINEEKAIRMLMKKNLVQEEVIVTIKKNEKFYSSFLSLSRPDKDAKHKKGHEDGR